jgi:hypothetical protein
MFRHKNPYAGKRLKLPENIYFKIFLDTSIVSLQNCLTRCSLKICLCQISIPAYRNIIILKERGTSLSSPLKWRDGKGDY